MWLINWLLDLWHQCQRSIDLQILWPVCKENAIDLEHARAAFALHACNDNAWLSLGEEEIKRRIDNLQ